MLPPDIRVVDMAYSRSDDRGGAEGLHCLKDDDRGEGMSFLRHPTWRRGVLFDELPARLPLVAHELREELVGAGGVVQRPLGERARLWVHRGLAELLGVHLAEAFEALQLDALARHDHDG